MQEQKFKLHLRPDNVILPTTPSCPPNHTANVHSALTACKHRARSPRSVWPVTQATSEATEAAVRPPRLKGLVQGHQSGTGRGRNREQFGFKHPPSLVLSSPLNAVLLQAQVSQRAGEGKREEKRRRVLMREMRERNITANRRAKGMDGGPSKTQMETL